jgi:diacylglycerol O-acyltransferase / wax synthase
MNGNDHLGQSDAFTWWMEADPLLRSTIVAVTLLERAPDWERLRARFDRASRLAPGFRRRLVEVPMKLATPRWVTDGEFDLDYHVRRVRVPEPATFEQVLLLAQTIGMASFDTARPLWEVTLVEGLETGEAALVLKVHHALTDGIGGMQLALFLYDLERDPPPADDDVAEPMGEHLGDLELVRDAIGRDLSSVAGMAWRAARSAIPTFLTTIRQPRETFNSAVELIASVGRTVAPVATTMSPVMTGRKLGWHYQVLDVPVNDLKAAAHQAGGTLNDGFLAGVTGGLRLYHEHHAAPVDELRVTMPISLRKEGDPVGGNRITIQRFTVPVGEPDPAERIRALHETAIRIRNEPSLDHTNAIAGGLNLLPRSYIGDMLKHVDFLASNVPGFRAPLFLAGAEVRRLYALGPTIGTSANITLLSYQDVSCVGVTTDNGAVADPDVFLTCMAAGFTEVLDLLEGHGPVSLAAS